MIILMILTLDIGIPLGTLILFFLLKKEKYLWSIPVVITIINAIYIFNKILTLYTDKPLSERIRLYIVNDSSMSIYIIHVPMVLFSIILTRYFIFIKEIYRKKR